MTVYGTQARAVHHLLRIWEQYGDLHDEPGKNVEFDHRNMRAGEDAGAFLVELGLAVDNGRSVVLTDEGQRILDDDSLDAGAKK